MKKSLLFGTGALAVVAVIAPASAQTASSVETEEESASAGDATARLDEVIVTAQRRAENVQDVPISITALSGPMLKDSNVVNLYDLPRVAPSLRVDTGITATRARVLIRGVGSQGGTGIEPSIATFQDGVYLPREAQSLGAYFDMAGLEVLRGPQGTLFGRNASVGAINLRSALPGDEASGRLSVEAGSGERFRTEGYYNLPLGEGAALRVAGFGELYDGPFYNKLDGNRYGSANSYALRLSGRFELTPDVSWIVRANVAGRDGNDAAMGPLMINSIPPGGLDVWNARLATIGATQDLSPFNAEFNQYVDDIVDDKQWGLNSTLEFDAGSGFAIKLINAYQDWDNSTSFSNVFTAASPTLSDHSDWESKSHSHELQLLSPLDMFDGRFSFVAGLYYFHEKWTGDNAFQLHPDGCTLLFPDGPVSEICPGQVDADLFNRTAIQTTDSYAVYGQGTFEILPTLDLVLGGRWTRDEKEGEFVQVVNSSLGSSFATPENRTLTTSNERFTHRVNLNWRPNDDLLLFGSYSTGYKSGGFDTNTQAAIVNRILRPETTRSTEVGIKSELFNRLLQANITAYRMTVKDFQDRTFDGPTAATFITNAGDIRNQGVEVDALLRASEAFRINASVAYLDSVFTSYPSATNLPMLPGTRDITGERPTFTPEWTGTVGAQYRGELGGGMHFMLRSDLSFVSSANIGQINNADPNTTQPAYQLVSARATLFGDADRWSVSVFGDNLTDEGYCTSFTYQPLGPALGLAVPGQSAHRCNTVGRPRTYGVTGSVSF